jgi:hypothetical protein
MLNDCHFVKEYSITNLFKNGSFKLDLDGTENEPMSNDIRVRYEHVKNLNLALKMLFPEKVDFETDLFKTDSAKYYIENAK